MLDARIHASIHAIGRERWNACCGDVLEGFDYLAAVEAADLPGFTWRYASIEEGGRLLAVAPGFMTTYSLDTMLTTFGRDVVAAVRRVAPGAFQLRLGALGSPCTETAGLVVAPGVAPAERRQLVRQVIATFATAVRREGCGLVAIKDVSRSDDDDWGDVSSHAGFSRAAGLPTALLDIDFPDVESYLSRLSAATRKDMRRKLKALHRIDIEIRTNIDDVADRIGELYRETRARADMQFETLTPAYFSGVLAEMSGRAMCVLYRARSDGTILAANLLIHDRETLLDKFFCMTDERGRDHNLYFVSWFTNVRLCLERGFRRYQSGQAGYATKLRLGSRLVGASMYFHHRNPVVNYALRWAAPLLSEPQPEAV